jgi:hypothetical protein
MIMTTKALVKHIKKQERSRRRPRAKPKTATGPQTWSKSVRAWVVEFNGRDRSEEQPAFDSLFKDAQPERTGKTD